MRVLIVDTETTGLDPETHELIEVGLVLYSVDHQCALQQFSTLLPMKAAENEAERINRIPSSVLRGETLDPSGRMTVEASRMISELVRLSDYFIAHNAAFDSKWFPSKLPGFTAKEQERPWLCTLEDFVWPNCGPGHLVNTALAHGIGVSSAHRALTDCLLISALFDRMADLPEMFKVAMRPKALFVADVPYPGTEAKQAGFRWNPDSRQWARRMAVEDAGKLGFRTRQVA